MTARDQSATAIALIACDSKTAVDIVFDMTCQERADTIGALRALAQSFLVHLAAEKGAPPDDILQAIALKIAE